MQLFELKTLFGNDRKNLSQKNYKNYLQLLAIECQKLKCRHLYVPVINCILEKKKKNYFQHISSAQLPSHIRTCHTKYIYNKQQLKITYVAIMSMPIYTCYSNETEIWNVNIGKYQTENSLRDLFVGEREKGKLEKNVFKEKKII